MKRNILFGLTGFLSLLGFVGIFTEARSFLAFLPLPWIFSTSFSLRTRWRSSSWPGPQRSAFTPGCW